jgi:hypothetical protein
MPKQLQCPTCRRALASRSLVDSDDRIYARWLYCYSCSYDSRKEPRAIHILAYEIAAAAKAGQSVSGEEVARKYNLDRGEVAEALRTMLERSLIRAADDDPVLAAKG